MRRWGGPMRDWGKGERGGEVESCRQSEAWAVHTAECGFCGCRWCVHGEGAHVGTPRRGPPTCSVVGHRLTVVMKTARSGPHLTPRGRRWGRRSARLGGREGASEQAKQRANEGASEPGRTARGRERRPSKNAVGEKCGRSGKVTEQANSLSGSRNNTGRNVTPSAARRERAERDPWGRPSGPSRGHRGNRAAI